MVRNLTSSAPGQLGKLEMLEEDDGKGCPPRGATGLYGLTERFTLPVMRGKKIVFSSDDSKTVYTIHLLGGLSISKPAS